MRTDGSPLHGKRIDDAQMREPLKVSVEGIAPADALRHEQVAR
jgi:hypothetical protein